LSLQLNPLLLLVPPTVMVSYAFMLPVSTGPNALAHSRSGMTTLEMAKVGCIPNLLVVGLVTLFTATYWDALFDLTGEQPEWALSGSEGNVTDPCRL
jgi:di/tricarboxylate transporter